jgi:hypothetical protein
MAAFSCIWAIHPSTRACACHSRITYRWRNVRAQRSQRSIKSLGTASQERTKLPNSIYPNVWGLQVTYSIAVTTTMNTTPNQPRLTKEGANRGARGPTLSNTGTSYLTNAIINNDHELFELPLSRSSSSISRYTRIIGRCTSGN